MTSIDLFRLIAMIAVFLTGIVGGLTAVRLGRSEGSARRLLSLGSAFSGGIFLGAGLLHMLPDSVDGFKSAFAHTDYPYAALLCAAGFAIVLMLERVVVGGDEVEVVSKGSSSKTAYVLLAVLSIHSMLAGTALGLESTFTGAAVLLLAIIAHKGSAAFALGMSLDRAMIPRTRATRLLLMFACATPIGIALGTVLSNLLSVPSGIVVEAVFDAIAAGTFLYVAVLDIINEEFTEPSSRWLKFVLLLFGLGLMAILAAFV